MGKGFMFMLFMWLVVSIGGGVMQGSISIAATALVAGIDADDNVIPVSSTTGFQNTGFIVILDETIGYASKNSTAFKGNWGQPVLRGAESTIAVAHSAGETVRTVESSMLNAALNYRIAVFADASGLIAFITASWGLLTGLLGFFVLPLSFLGTDLAILTYIWAILSIGMLVSLAIVVIGGRRV